MILKFKMAFFFWLCVLAMGAQGQTSPVQWVNQTYTINVDTVTTKNALFPLQYSDSPRSNQAHFTFENIGTHVTFIDSSFSIQSTERCIAKPRERKTISLNLRTFKGIDFYAKKDTTVKLSLPFYYEGEIVREEVSCCLTFGESKLITHDNFQIDTTAWVMDIVKEDSLGRTPSLCFTHYFTITNISNQPIYCTKQLIAWNDAQDLQNRMCEYELVLPGHSYKIPARLNMDRRYRFKSRGVIEVFTDNFCETFGCEVVSNYRR